LAVAVAYVAGTVITGIFLFKFYEVPAKRFVIGKLAV
jgi:hypothetical protein